MGRYMLKDAEYLRTAPQFLVGEPKTISLSTTSATLSAALSAGYYRYVSDVSSWFVQCSATGTEVTTSNGHYLPAGSREYFVVNAENDQNVAAITDAGTGTAYISRMR